MMISFGGLPFLLKIRRLINEQEQRRYATSFGAPGKKTIKKALFYRHVTSAEWLDLGWRYADKKQHLEHQNKECHRVRMSEQRERSEANESRRSNLAERSKGNLREWPRTGEFLFYPFLWFDASAAKSWIRWMGVKNSIDIRRGTGIQKSKYGGPHRSHSTFLGATSHPLIS